MHPYVANGDPRTGRADNRAENFGGNGELVHIAIGGGHERVGAALDFRHAWQVSSDIVRPRFTSGDDVDGNASGFNGLLHLQTHLHEAPSGNETRLLIRSP